MQTDKGYSLLLKQNDKNGKSWLQFVACPYNDATGQLKFEASFGFDDPSLDKVFLMKAKLLLEEFLAKPQPKEFQFDKQDDNIPF